jgi:hypothetical protein
MGFESSIVASATAMPLAASWTFRIGPGEVEQ